MIIRNDLAAISSKPNIDTFYSMFARSQEEVYAFCYFHSKLCGKHLNRYELFFDYQKVKYKNAI
jgi:hypothetical protein